MQLRAAKPNAYLINVGRGELVDQSALAAALREGRLGGAVVDVVSPEPLPPDSELWEVPNLWITPHLSADTYDGWQRGIDLFCSNLRLFLDGHPERMGNIVDVEAHL
jgi:phosphoglycerate dehydrogenase-like enzyme